MAISMGEQSMPPMDTPTMRIGVDLAVTAVSATGDIITHGIYRFGVPELRRPRPGGAAPLEAVGADLKNISNATTATADHEGRADGHEQAVQSAQMMDSVKNSLNSI
jgi:hypothetical protein